jgi:hypothetical protein
MPEKYSEELQNCRRKGVKNPAKNTQSKTITVKIEREDSISSSEEEETKSEKSTKTNKPISRD